MKLFKYIVVIISSVFLSVHSGDVLFQAKEEHEKCENNPMEQIRDSSVEDAIMFPWYKGYDHTKGLPEDDKRGIQYLHPSRNKQRGSNPYRPRPTTATTTTTTTTTTTALPLTFKPHIVTRFDPRYNDPRYNDHEYNNSRYNGKTPADPTNDIPRNDDPHRDEPRNDDPRFNDPRNNHPQHKAPRRNDPRNIDPRTNYPRPNDPSLNYPRRNDPRHNEPRHNDPKSNDPRHEDPRQSDPRYKNPKPNDRGYDDPRYNDPLQNYPRNNDSKNNDRIYNDPRYKDPRYNDPRYNDPRYNDPRYNDPRYDPRNPINDPRHEKTTHYFHHHYHHHHKTAPTPRKHKPRPVTEKPERRNRPPQTPLTYPTTKFPHYPHIDRSKPDDCNMNFDSISMIRGELFIFKDKYLWRIGERGLYSGYPHETRRLWNQLPENLTHIDAVYENRDRKIVFFIGKQYYVFNSNMLEKGYPKPITELGLPESMDKIDAAFVWGYNNRTYFCGNTLYYRFDEDIRKVELDYPRDMSIWQGIGYHIDCAFQYTNGKTYFFKGKYFWEFDDNRMRVAHVHPKPNHKWLRCSRAHETDKNCSCHHQI